MAGADKADSQWEGKLRDTVLKSTVYHPAKITYTVKHKYQPDFMVARPDMYKDNIITYIEAKGRFRDSSEASKYKWIRDNLPLGAELVFLLHTPSLPMPNAKLRKCGTKQSHKEWCERNKFRWFDENTIKEIL